MNLPSLIPEMILVAVAAAIFLGGAFWDVRRLWGWTAWAALASAALALGFGPAPGLVRWLAVGFGALLVPLAARAASAESLGALLVSIAGWMLVARAADLATLFIGLELVSIPTYVLLALGRHDAEGRESTAKYFFLSVLSSAVLLYGFSFFYGVTGSLELRAVQTAVPTGFAAFDRLAAGLIFAGLCFKITAVPFQFYAPDVYEGNTYPNAAMLSVVPKAAGLAAMVKLLAIALPCPGAFVWQMVLAVAILSMTLGNALALWQDNLRRMLAYSSIAQSGYLLIGLATAMGGVASGHWDGIAAMWFYFVTYAAATTGAMAALEHLGRSDRRLDGIEELAGLGRTRPAVAAVLAVCLLGLTGVPPLAGFWGKLLLFGGALNVGGSARLWFIALAVVGALNAAVGAAYYLRVVAVMYFRTPLATPRAEGGRGALWIAVGCALLTIAIGVWPGPWRVGCGTWRAENQEAAPMSRLEDRTPQDSPQTKKTATPVCPEPWRGGARQCSFWLGDAIIEDASDNIVSPRCEFVTKLRKNLQ
ncbi:MAG: NADH-quinone oxidoreductase subunit N [Thermoguttaceae bacterium]